jgi:hypothetical protein
VSGIAVQLLFFIFLIFLYILKNLDLFFLVKTFKKKTFSTLPKSRVYLVTLYYELKLINIHNYSQ